MSIIRNCKNKDNPYVMIFKGVAQDPNLSLKAKGFMLYVLSLPDDWQIYEKELIKHFKDGRDSIRATIKELIDAGYIEREKKRDEKGLIKGYEYRVFEEPIQSGLSGAGLTNIGKTNIGKPAPTNNNLTNKDLTNNDCTNINAEKRKNEKPPPSVTQTPVNEGDNSSSFFDSFLNMWKRAYFFNLRKEPEIAETDIQKIQSIIDQGITELEFHALLKEYFGKKRHKYSLSGLLKNTA